MAIGLAFLPVAVVMALFSVRLSAQLIASFGPWAILVVGQLVVALAMVMMAAGPTIPNYMVHMLFPMALLGLGGGLSFPSLTMIALAGVRPEESGLASGLLNTTGQVGGAFGLAVQDALAGGYHLAWLVGACTVIVTLVVAVTMLRSGKSMECAVAPVECAAAA